MKMMMMKIMMMKMMMEMNKYTDDMVAMVTTKIMGLGLLLMMMLMMNDDCLLRGLQRRHGIASA